MTFTGLARFTILERKPDRQVTSMRDITMVELVLSILLTVSAHYYTAPALAQPDPSAESQALQLMKRSKKSKLELQAMVDALANRNRAPEMVRREPIFSRDYDWSEYNRAWKAILALVPHAEDAWPELVSHLDDERYALTLRGPSGKTDNWTVSSVCRMIVARNLSEAYYRNLNPEAEIVYARLRSPEIARNKNKLKSWCEKRSKRSLYELQIEMCEWAIGELQAPDEFPPISRLRLQAWIASIKAEIE
jgi:hypothetical protein